MKTFLHLVTVTMLVLFMSACSGSSSSDGGTSNSGIPDGGTPDSEIPDGNTENYAVENAIQTGVYTSSFNGAAEKTWYTWKSEIVQNGTTYIINTASFNAPSDATTIAATSAIGTDGRNGHLIFTLPFDSGVTTGDLVLGQVTYGDSRGATLYGYYQGIQGADIVAHITQATNVGNVLHIKGSFSGTLSDGMDNSGNLKDPHSISVEFEFDAHRTDIGY